MNIKSQKGSILLATLSFIIMLAIAAGSILELTMNSYKLTKRNELRVEARSVAESELENIYYRLFTLILADLPANITPSDPSITAIADTDPLHDIKPTTANRRPFLDAHYQQGWRVMRSVSHDPNFDEFTGIIPQTSKYGKVNYITARVVVQPNPGNFFNYTQGAFHNEVAVKVGRRFFATKSSIFQYGVFYQGDMELAPGGAIIINGAVAANGSIYAGANAVGGSLTFQGKVRYLMGDYFNMDSTGSTVLRKPGTLVSGGALVAPVFSVGPSQLEEQSAPENLIGGVDVTELTTRRGDLFPYENDVYRAAILPPPEVYDENPVTYDSALGDDPIIDAQRMYTRAGLRVTIETNGTFTFTKVDGAITTDVTASINAAATVITGTIPLYDKREAKNVDLTTVDMGALKTAIETVYSDPAHDFNGSIYFYVKGSTLANPRAIRLSNAQTIFARSGKGLAVTTNGGVYVQGDYNTLQAGAIPNKVDPAANPPVGVVPAMIMGDQVTVLSAGWLDGNASLDKSNRVATADITIQAGILTGNVSSSSTVASGGVQSLVRYLEAWGPQPSAPLGHNVVFLGSLGRLFESQTFTAAWNQPGLGDVYGTPASRTFTFDSLLRDNPPAGSPTTTGFDRGTFFVWN